jgi:hypothetical protein
MRVVEGQAIVLATVNRRDAAPEITDEMVATVFDSYQEQVAFAFLSGVPIAHQATVWEVLVNGDRLARFLAAEDRFYPDPALQDGPIAALGAGDLQKEPVLVFLFFDDADEDVVGSGQHLVLGHLRRHVENQAWAAAR